MNGKKLSQFNLSITAFPRVHVTLIGMNDDGYRINGGFGFSISDPKMHFKFKVSESFRFIDKRTKGFSKEEIDSIESVVEVAKIEHKLISNIECYIAGEASTHYGLGTSTVTYLACLEALFIINKYPYSQYVIQKYSKRGGTSGIGIHTYFKGGFIFDIGLSNLTTNKLVPSSISFDRKKLPLVISSGESPDWSVGIVLPNEIDSKTELEEIEFFKTTCPISHSEVNSTLYEVLYGALASLIEDNIRGFQEAINKIQRTKWKSEERKLYGNKIDHLERLLAQNGINSVGMSSLGPGLYFLFDSSNFVQELSTKLNSKVFFTKLNNSPRIISYE